MRLLTLVLQNHVFNPLNKVLFKLVSVVWQSSRTGNNPFFEPFARRHFFLLLSLLVKHNLFESDEPARNRHLFIFDLVLNHAFLRLS